MRELVGGVGGRGDLMGGDWIPCIVEDLRRELDYEKIIEFDRGQIFCEIIT